MIKAAVPSDISGTVSNFEKMKWLEAENFLRTKRPLAEKVIR